VPAVDTDEQVCVEARQHGIVLARPFVLAFVVATIGAICARHGGPLPFVGAGLLALAALIGVRGVWRWERRRVLVTTERLAVVDGTLRRRTAGVPLRTLDALELEQSVPGRILGYGTLVAGPLEVPYVPEARRVYRLVTRLAA
jgi:uncharacterized membrane protein YdbT with pleckstrin-like domain